MSTAIASLILFSRYPEPGTTKTRLIPALGAAGAAALQRQMTELIVDKARAWQGEEPGRDLAIYFAGGTAQPMAAWLGSDLTFCPQSEGDLGARLQGAFTQRLTAGATQVVAIGSDCPDISVELLDAGFAALQNADLVLGPAKDGGYYLIGLRRSQPELFVDMPWGGPEVLRITRERAKSLGLRTQELIELNDIDRPEDLPIWEPHVKSI